MKESTNVLEADGHARVHRVQSQASISAEEQKQKLRQFVSGDHDLCQDVQEQLVHLFERYHDCFSLTENERGWIDLPRVKKTSLLIEASCH